jgi:hypothetical protein
MGHEPSVGLSLSQEFNLKAFEYQIDPINLEQSKQLLVELYKQLLLREAYCKELLKERIFGDSPFSLEFE